MSKLCIHAGGKEVSVEQLDDTFTPEATHSWTPINHGVLLGQVRNALTRSGWEIQNEQHAIAKEGNRYFGLIDVKHGAESADYTLLS